MKIGIISLGWLGKQLHKKLKTGGHEVWGTYAHTSKGVLGEFKYDIQSDTLPESAQSDWIVFNLPPSTFDLDSFKRFLGEISNSKLIFISSTSVYGQEGELDETHRPIPKTENGKFLLECENLVEQREGKAIIIRPAGLYGEARHPGNYLSGREVSLNPEEKVNLVGGKDLCELITKAIQNPSAPLIINAVNANHPGKGEYYRGYCQRRHIPEPVFQKTEGSGQSKVISTSYQDFLIDSALP